MRITTNGAIKTKFGWSGSAAVAKIFEIIRIDGPITRLGLENRTGISRSAIALHVNVLQSIGLIKRIGGHIEGEGRRGRSFAVNESGGYFVGIDLDRTLERVSVGLFNLSLAIIGESSKVFPWHVMGQEKLMDQIILLIRRLLESYSVSEKRFWGIGVSVPAPVNPQTGDIVFAPFLGRTQDSSFSKLSRSFSCPIRVENDSNVMAMAEMGKGVARGVKDFIFLRVGHGVGAGIVAGGMLYRGFRGFSGEVGHTIFDGSSKVCVCGNQGCVETEAGSDAVLEEAALLAKKDSGSYLAKHLDSYNGITLRDIGIAAGAGDEACMKLIKKTGEALGVAVSSLVNVLNPELIVVGGPTTDLGEMLLTSMRQSLMRRTLPQSTSELVVRRTKLGDSIGMVGAAYMVQEDILSSKNVVKIIDQHKAGTLERRQRARRK